MKGLSMPNAHLEPKFECIFSILLVLSQGHLGARLSLPRAHRKIYDYMLLAVLIIPPYTHS